MRFRTARRVPKPRVSLEKDIKAWIGYVVCFLLLFVLPIKAVDIMNAPATPVTNPIKQAAVLGETTSRYVTLPLLNFRFDTWLKETSTIAFLAGTVVLVVAVVIILLLFRNFKKREQKYS